MSYVISESLHNDPIGIRIDIPVTKIEPKSAESSFAIAKQESEFMAPEKETDKNSDLNVSEKDSHLLIIASKLERSKTSVNVGKEKE
jgi:hypothetical protein